MAEKGVTFTGEGAMDVSGKTPGNTQPPPPGRSSGGPVETPKGLDTGSNHSKTTPSYDISSPQPNMGGGGSVLDSPIDK
jgi:hypothetical protein